MLQIKSDHPGSLVPHSGSCKAFVTEKRSKMPGPEARASSSVEKRFLSQTNWLLLKSEVSFLARLLSYCFACASPAVCFSALAFGLKLGILILLLWSGLLFTAFFVLKLLLRRLNCAGGRRGRRRGKGELTWLMVPHKPFPSATICPSLHLVSVT